jgi:hypothetical protein
VDGHECQAEVDEEEEEFDEDDGDVKSESIFDDSASRLKLKDLLKPQVFLDIKNVGKVDGDSDAVGLAVTRSMEKWIGPGNTNPNMDFLIESYALCGSILTESNMQDARQLVVALGEKIADRIMYYHASKTTNAEGAAAAANALKNHSLPPRFKNAMNVAKEVAAKADNRKGTNNDRKPRGGGGGGGSGGGKRGGGGGKGKDRKGSEKKEEGDFQKGASKP